MSLTGANSVIFISVPALFGTPFQLQGFAADDVFDVDQVRRAETLMGVDGFLSAGWVWEQVPQTFSLQSDSPSMIYFDQWQQFEAAIEDKYEASMTITLPGVSMQFNGTRGFLTAASPMPTVKKLIQPRKFTIEWEQITPAQILSLVATA